VTRPSHEKPIKHACRSASPPALAPLDPSADPPESAHMIWLDSCERARRARPVGEPLARGEAFKPRRRSAAASVPVPSHSGARRRAPGGYRRIRGAVRIARHATPARRRHAPSVPVHSQSGALRRAPGGAGTPRRAARSLTARQRNRRTRAAAAMTISPAARVGGHQLWVLRTHAAMSSPVPSSHFTTSACLPTRASTV
jgi:hypothetical protein